jgi:murein DD-endopeptidase MepM/ murein hydrolase activator NlpD
MKHLQTTCLLIIFSLSVLGQTDSAKLFESSKGKWPIPVSRYLKIYDNENLKHFTSNQFDSTLRIITNSSYQVRAVHDGTVTSVIEVNGEYTVLTNFGNYFVSYGRLKKTNLVKGIYIRAGQQLGQVIKDWTEDNYTLEISLSKGEKQLSAEKWIDW